MGDVYEHDQDISDLESLSTDSEIEESEDVHFCGLNFSKEEADK